MAEGPAIARRNAPARLVVGMTSLPTRIAAIRPALESLLHGEQAPDAIILSLPQAPLRGRAPWQLPAFLLDPAWHGGRLHVNWLPGDLGPGTKLLGALPLLEPDTLIVLADDDVRYHPRFLAGIEAAARRSAGPAAFSYYTYRLRGLRVGQGCDGFAMRTADVATARSFYDRHVADTDLMFHDDLWISHLLATQRIATRRVALPAGAALVYRQVHEIDALRHLDDALGRERLNRVEGARLRRAAPIPLRHRMAMTMDHFRNVAWPAFRRPAFRRSGATF